jgi:hypothetical protein
LRQLDTIIREELDLDEKLIALCKRDSRLGFHSEAEGYKYFPEKIRWRMRQLRRVLVNDVPELKKFIRNGELLFPEYTGKKPAGRVAHCVPSKGTLWSSPESDLPADLSWQSSDFGPGESTVQWAAAYDANAIYIVVSDSSAAEQPSSASPISSVVVKVEPQRLWPCRRFVFNPGAEKPVESGLRVASESGRYRVVVRISLERIGLSADNLHPIRIDVRVQKRNGGTSAWCPSNPTTSRLILGSDNPADLGWMLFGSGS